MGGAFSFRSLRPGEYPTYPSLWSADAGTQRAILTPPTREGNPVVDRERMRRMLGQRSSLFVSRTLRFTSQAVAAAQAERLMMGGRAWAALVSDDDGVKAALAIWLNATPGLLVRSSYAQTAQSGRATMQIRALAGFPIPNFAADSDAGQQARVIAQQHIAERNWRHWNCNRHLTPSRTPTDTAATRLRWRW